MVYTSAIYSEHDCENESLEQAQVNKLDIVARKIDMKPGEQHLDIGCGWGTFVCHCARENKADSYGITIAKEQIDWGNESINKKKNLLVMERQKLNCWIIE